MMRRRSKAAAVTATGIRSANAPVTALDIAAVNGNLMATSYWCTLRSVELSCHLVTAAATEAVDRSRRAASGSPNAELVDVAANRHMRL